MVLHIQANNVNDAFSTALRYFATGIRWGSVITRESRVGEVYVYPTPVITTYKEPQNRVLLSPMRDANPFFHFMEALWMLAGHHDLRWPMQFNKRFAEYSDDGVTVHDAYGYRWRRHFAFNQLELLSEQIRADPATRRAVLTMWAPQNDLFPFQNYALNSEAPRKAVPCNTHAYFDTRDGRLNMTVCCRSNDVVWGAYGANAVHFSFLLEYMALLTEMPIGVYRQFSNDLHIYKDIIKSADEMFDMAQDVDNTTVTAVNHTPLFEKGQAAKFKIDLESFLADPSGDGKYDNPFFSEIAVPMYFAWAAHKQKAYAEALDVWVPRIRDLDWEIACGQWIVRRRDRSYAKNS